MHNLDFKLKNHLHQKVEINIAIAIMTESKTHCVIYVRCSTEYQDTTTQLYHCSQYAMSNRWLIRGIYHDNGLSGLTVENRQGLSDALDALNEHDYLVVHSISRLTRDLDDFEAIMERLNAINVVLYSVSEKCDSSTLEGRDTIQLLVAAARKESELISSRVTAGMQAHKAKFGISNNKARYGWKYHQVGKGSSAVVTLLPVRHEQEVIKLIKQLRSTKRKPEKYPNGKERPMPFEEIAEELNKRGIPSRLRHRDAMRTPCKWYGEAVRKIIEKEGNLDPSTNDHEYPDDDEIRDVVPDTYLYLLMKGTGTRVGSANTLHEIYSIPGRTDQTKVHIFSCKSSKDKEQILLQWLSEKGYIIREESPDTLQMCANVPEILEYTKTLTRCDNPQLVTIAELREIIQKEAKKQPH